MRCHDLSKVETGGEALFPIQGLQHAEIVGPSNTDPKLAWPACRKACLGKMIRKLLEVFGHLPPPYDQLSVLTSVLNKSVSTLKDTRHRMTSWTAEVKKETQTWATTLGAFYKDHGSTGVLTEWKDLLVQVDSLESTGRLAHPLPGDWTVACPPQSLIRMVTEAGERLVEDVAQDHGITAIKASQEVYHHMDHVNEAIRAQVSDIMAKARADIAAKLRETQTPPGPGLEAQLQQAAGAAGGGQEVIPGFNPELHTSTMALTSRRPNPSDWVTIESNGDFYWFHDDDESTLMRKECHESSLTTCECLVINIDSESTTSHLSPRTLAVLRDRRHPLALQLMLTTLLGPHTMRSRVEGVIGLLGRCEAVHSVEIRFVDMRPAMEENPTYEQLPVGAWFAERLMASFPKCLSLRLQDFQCQHAQLAELLSHSHFLGSLQNLDIQELHIQDGSIEDGHYEWVEGYLGLTVLSTVYLGPVPTPLQPFLPHSKLMKLSLTEMHLTDASLLPQTIQILNITYLHVTLPEPDQQATTSGVAALSSGRFKTLDIGFVGLTITSLEGGGHASLAALKPLVGRFKRSEVELREIAPNGEHEVELIIHNMVTLLQGCTGVVFMGYKKPLSSWCMYRLKGSMAQGATVEVQG
ncbi:hypothetical protein V8C86DRAFT_3032224 [Haematococcus lacustris]